MIDRNDLELDEQREFKAHMKELLLGMEEAINLSKKLKKFRRWFQPTESLTDTDTASDIFKSIDTKLPAVEEALPKVRAWVDSPTQNPPTLGRIETFTNELIQLNKFMSKAAIAKDKLKPESKRDPFLRKQEKELQDVEEAVRIAIEKQDSRPDIEETKKQILKLLDKLLENYNKEPKKSNLMRCRAVIANAESQEMVAEGFKTAILFSLQRQRFGLTNTTSLGEKLKTLLNLPEFKALKKQFFTEEPLVRYRDLRELVASFEHPNPTKFFSSRRKENMGKFEQKLADLEKSIAEKRPGEDHSPS